MKTPFYLMLFKTQHAQSKKNRETMDEYHLSPGQPKVLRYLNAHQDCKLKDIADECDIESATVSKMIDNLEKKEMLTREINPKNKRAYQLNITEYGKESLKKWNAHCIEIENISLKDFSEEEKEQFEDFLNELLEPYNKSPKKVQYKVQLLTTTIYNYKELSKAYKEQTQLGYSKMLPQIALGQTQSSILATAYFENEVLDLVSLFIPPMQSSVMNADMLDRTSKKIANGDEKEAGRPEKEDDQKSTKTLQNKESMS